jgi:hypothetical protein
MPRWEYHKAIEWMAGNYDERFFFEGEGFGTKQVDGNLSKTPPAFLRRFVTENPDNPSAISLKKKIAWCDAQAKEQKYSRIDNKYTGMTRDELLAAAKNIIGSQREDGAFVFDPDGRHYMKDDFVVARAFHEPMGQSGDPALEFCVSEALHLLKIAACLNKQDAEAVPVRSAAYRALDFCADMTRPEGGDYWETPLHAPNLLAAGNAAISYELAYRESENPAYREKAIHYIRALLPFTHLWEPKGNPMLYYTKPCLCSSDWYFANWVRDHVQWEVLEVFAHSARLGIEWAGIDPGIDWDRYQRGITHAAMRWIVDKDRECWLPHNLPWTYDMFIKGDLDGCYPDTHNSVSGNYGGAMILPDHIAENIYAILDRAAGNVKN